ncbi:type III restriction/modification system, restriction subunit [Arcobacter acticola]|uniref:Type III restriction/modification system, restriction subunit n=1 Tax=Arcobacter acticola TaxID=1849015 RepID=A0A6M8EFR1_9BACT|nr:DEAD/DEAH box helicase family protein [Arcobacter acticola]QKE28266.1 type III restriction/modification system, restriction subunit [Arcobacter acticola]
MKIQFESQLQYQNDAINSMVDIFEGQEICQSNFTVSSLNDNLFTMTNDLGIGNRLELLEDDILLNIQNIQLRNGLPQTKSVKDLKTMDFSVEMETGTGKTYVYLKTMFEMNRKYGFTKFIIVVPSIAIKEGTNKTLEITEEHFKSIFDNVKYDYFVYDSSNLEQVRDFATSSDIRIMIINIDAFRKSFTDITKENTANLIHRTNDRLNGMKPIDFISSTNPIVIIDEPQSVDSTPKSKEAIKTLNPLCKLRYSATHIDKHNLLYKLDSIDAYEQKLVKQIEVANVRTTDNQNQAYIKVMKFNKKPISVVLELDVNDKGKIKRTTKTIKDGSILYDITKRDVYEDYNVNDIYVEEGNEYVQFSNGTILRLSESIGDVDEDTIKRLQIRKTIEEHLDKEMKLNPRGIKVLSLFFIDKVSNYREYDEEGNPIKGKFSIWFEEEYQRVIKYPKYKNLFEEHQDINVDVEKIHDGYFSQDKKGNFKDSSENPKGELKGNKDDEDTFNRIMKNKEKLLSFEDNLRFIFSHSALKEGWDNPNVFQICTLKEGTKSEIRRRQEIGRGLRICVNQDGERVYGFDVNTLTVMANETYEQFAEGLQKEIEKEEGIKFGVIQEHIFSNITYKNEKGEIVYLGADSSEKLTEYLKEKEYIDSRGKVQDSLRMDLNNNTFEVPEEYIELKPQIVNVIKSIAGKLNVKNADDKKVVRVNKQVLLGEDFKNLWNKIKFKTTYRVDFNEEDLIKECVKHIQNEVSVTKIKYLYSKAKNKITKVGVEVDDDTLIKDKYVDSEIIDYKLPDIITYIQNETNLTRKVIVDILVKSEKLNDFKNNPQKFIEKVVEIIKKTMNMFIVDGIKYQRLGDEYYYAQESFENEELIGYLNKNMYENLKHSDIQNEYKTPFEYTVYDSDIELKFAQDFDRNPDVKLFTKLPNWFKINTPLGTYNPDWAVLIEKDNSEKLYFVVESKGADLGLDLRNSESAKIECGKRHFKALDTDVELKQASSLGNLMEKI